MHLLPWYTAAAAAAQAQPGNRALPCAPWHQQLATGDLHANQPVPALSARVLYSSLTFLMLMKRLHEFHIKLAMI